MEINKKLSVNELFSGIGAQRKALLNIGFDVEIIGISEIDKHAIQSYEAIFGKTRNYGDISTVERLDYADLWTYSFPCTDISVAGLQKGINENTRSGLLYQVQRLLDIAKIEGTLPKYLLLENVKNLVGKQFKPQFDEWIKYLDELGYNTHWQVLNAKDYGIPQNRERVFAVSIRKDVDLDFEFPPKIKLEKRLKDVLEDNVDESFYLTEKQIERILNSNFNQEATRIQGDVCQTLLARDYKDPKCVKIDNEPKIQKIDIPQIVRVRKYEVDSKKLKVLLKEHKKYTNKEIANKLNIPQTKVEHWFRNDDCFAIPDAEYWFVLKELLQIKTDEFDKSITIFEEKEGTFEKSNRCYFDTGLSPTLTATSADEKVITDLRIRKLTPKECWRLMGFNDADFEKAKASGVSNSQLYKQAGNSIVVNVLEKIFKMILTGLTKYDNNYKVIAEKPKNIQIKLRLF